MRITVIFYCFLFFAIFACGDALDYTLYSTELPSDAKRLTARNLEKLKLLPAQEVFKIAVIADTHNYYEDLAAIVDIINSRTDVSFVIVLGDITYTGLRDEYLRFHDIIKKLYVPYLTLIGNHDTLSKGKIIYRKMFGPLNYSFDYSGTRFVMLNSNQREFSGDAPDFNWLQSQLQESIHHDNVIVFAHIPPEAKHDWISVENVNAWKGLMEMYNVKFSINGHTLPFYHWTDNNVNYVVVGDVRDINYGILTISKDGIVYEQCSSICEIML